MEERFTFFWGSASPFSQWYTGAPFHRHGVCYPTAEHWMMCRKAALFGSPAALQDRILATDARGAKTLGRSIEGFSESIWNVAARAVVTEGNLAKFSQNPAAFRALLRTAGTTLVEASPVDTIWGIGLAADHPAAQDRSRWRGTNWLGEVLTDIRDAMLAACAAAGGGLPPGGG